MALNGNQFVMAKTLAEASDYLEVGQHADDLAATLAQCWNELQLPFVQPDTPGAEP